MNDYITKNEMEIYEDDSWEKYIVNLSDLQEEHLKEIIMENVGKGNIELVYNNEPLYIRSPPTKRSVDGEQIKLTEDELRFLKYCSGIANKKFVPYMSVDADITYKDYITNNYVHEYNEENIIEIYEDQMKYFDSCIECIYELFFDSNYLSMRCCRINFIANDSAKITVKKRKCSDRN